MRSDSPKFLALRAATRSSMSLSMSASESARLTTPVPDASTDRQRRRSRSLRPPALPALPHACGGTPQGRAEARRGVLRVPTSSAARAAATSACPDALARLSSPAIDWSSATATDVLKSSSIAAANRAVAAVGSASRRRRHAAQRQVQPLERGVGLREALRRVVDRPAVMAGEHEVAHHLGVAHPLEHLAHGEEVAERLRHLLVVHAHEAVVHPDVHELRAAGGAGLRDLVLVVRELEVHAAAVDVEVLAEQLDRHRRALDVPAGTARAPRRLPGRLAGLGGLPQHEVERVALGLVHLDARAGAQVCEPLAGQLPVRLEVRHGVVHVAVRADVGVALVDQRLHHRRRSAAGARWRAARGRPGARRAPAQSS